MEIKKICVLGAGLMGAGIAQVSAEAGYEVSMRDIEDRFVQGGLNIIRGMAIQSERDIRLSGGNKRHTGCH